MSRFIVLPARILDDERLLGSPSLRVLMILCKHTDKHGWAWPSRRTIADVLGVSVGRISQCTKELADWGYIEIHAHVRASDGSQTSNRYRVMFDFGAPVDNHADDDTPPYNQANPPVSPMELTPPLVPRANPLKVPKNVPKNEGIHSAGEEAVDEQFEEAWRAYPKRAGGNSKRGALKAWNARLAAGDQAADLLAGTKRYAGFCAATGKVGTEFVKLAATFFGPDRHFAELWALPVEQNRTGGNQKFDPVSFVNRNRPGNSNERTDDCIDV